MRWPFLVVVAACSFDPGGAPGGPNPGDSDAQPGQLADASVTGQPDAPTASPNAFRRDIRITPPGAVTADVSDVVVPIRLSGDAHLMQNADPSGQDILVETAVGQSLPIDVELLDVAAGELVAWVKVPSVATAGTTLHMYYGVGQTAPAAANPWQGLVDAVWHLGALGSAPTAVDSSGNGIHGTKDSSGSLALTTGVYGSGYDWNATQVLVPTNSDLDRGSADSFTTVMWFNQQSALSTFDFAFHNGGPIDNVPGYEFSLGTGAWTAGIRDTGGDELTLEFGTESSLGNAGWLQLALVVDRSTNTASALVNGVVVDTGSIGSFGDLRNNSRLARIGGGLNPPDALIDEFRAYVVALSVDYLVLDYALATDPTAVTVEPAIAVRYPGT